jgi:integrase
MSVRYDATRARWIADYYDQTGKRHAPTFGKKREATDYPRRAPGRFYFPKTKTSRRNVQLAPELVAELRRWKLACRPSRLGLVFPGDRAGSPRTGRTCMPWRSGRHCAPPSSGTSRCTRSATRLPALSSCRVRP